MSTDADDIGLAALARIHKDLLIDEQWTERHDRSFWWIGHHLKQKIRASKCYENRGTYLSKLFAETLVVSGVRADEAQVLRVLSELNAHALGSAYSFDRASRTVRASAIAFVHKDTFSWRVPQFAGYVIAQLAVAETEAEYIADKLAGAVAKQGMEGSGVRREERDDMLNVLEDLFAVEGQEPSRFANAFEFETIADIANKSPRVATLGGGASGISLDIAYGSDTSLAQLDSQTPHRRIGRGLTAWLRLPTTVTQEEADRIAGSLNLREAMGETETQHYGAWYCDELRDNVRTVTYQMFLPNRLHLPGVAQDASYCLVERARWADRVLNNAVSEAQPWKLLVERTKTWFGK